MKSYIACTLALIAALSQVSATAVTCSESAAACGNGLSLTTYTQGHYAVRGADFVNTGGANGKAQLVKEGGKHYLKVDGKYFCDSNTPKSGGFKVTPGGHAAKECEVEVRACDKYGDRLQQEPTKPGCIAFFFTNTGHYLSAGLTDNLNQGVQSQTWCRTWEYHYGDCAGGSSPPSGYGPSPPSGKGGNTGGYGGSSPPTGGYGGSSPPTGGYGGSSPPTGGYGGSSHPTGGYGGSSPPTGGYGGSSPPTGGYGGSSPPTGGYGGSSPPSGKGGNTGGYGSPPPTGGYGGSSPPSGKGGNTGGYGSPPPSGYGHGGY